LYETGFLIVSTFFESDRLHFEWDSHFSSGGRAMAVELTAIWVSAGISFAVVLIVIVAVVFHLGCRLLKPATDATESEIEANIPADGDVSSRGDDPFLSEENALSADREIHGELADDFSEGDERPARVLV
jgi:hypothetical protein